MKFSSFGRSGHADSQCSEKYVSGSVPDPRRTIIDVEGVLITPKVLSLVFLRK